VAIAHGGHAKLENRDGPATTDRDLGGFITGVDGGLGGG
jgi:uncharacterized protein with beta-barrel porin domain